MAAMPPTVVSCAVEGLVDEAVVRRVVEEAGLTMGPVYGRKGKQFLLRHLNGYNQAARFGVWLVLVDLDAEWDCAPPAVRTWLPHPEEGMYLRAAVRAVESWLMADAERFADFIGVSRSLMPRDPEGLADPKQAVIGLAARSRWREVREDLVPRQGSGRSEGELYVSRMIGFVREHWRSRVAAQAADSLGRCLQRLDGMAASAQRYGR